MGSHDIINNMWCPQYIEDTALEFSVREPVAYYERQAWKHGGPGTLSTHPPPFPLPVGGDTRARNRGRLFIIYTNGYPWF